MMLVEDLNGLPGGTYFDKELGQRASYLGKMKLHDIY